MMGKRHEKVDRNGNVVVIAAVCDRELLGKKFKQGKAVLDLKKHAGFYSGKELSEGEAVELIRESRNLNLVGVKAVAAARKALKVGACSVKRVKGVPHLQVYYL